MSQGLHTLKVGDPGPVNNEVICAIVLKTENFIVYLDREDNVRWYANSSYGDYAPDFGLVSNKVAHYEILIDRHFKGKERHQFKELVGEGLARLLDDRKSENAVMILEEAKAEIICLVKEKLRIRYLQGSLFFATLAAFGLVLCVCYKTIIKTYSEESYVLLLSCFAEAWGHLFPLS